jgi:hypothetical protein
LVSRAFRRLQDKENRLEVTLAALADYASVSQDGKINIMGIFQHVSPAELPFHLPMLFIVLGFQASQAEIGLIKTIRITLIDTEGREKLRLEQTIAVPPSPRPGRRPTLTHVVGINGVRFEEAGDYAFSVLINEEEKASLPLTIDAPRDVAETSG